MITLYTTHCPRCELLKTKLEQKHISYETCTDEQKMLEKGLVNVPALEINGEILNFKSALIYIDQIKEDDANA